MIARAFVNGTFDSATTLEISLGQAGFKEAAIYVPALSTDSYVTVALSYDGTTYLTLTMTDGAGSEYNVEVPSARVRVIPLGGAKFIKLTAPTNTQTVTVYITAV